jgi:hypothetical protein
MELKLHGWPLFLKNSKLMFVSYILKNILGVDNVELYQRTKLKFKIRYILGYK